MTTRNNSKSKGFGNCKCEFCAYGSENKFDSNDIMKGLTWICHKKRPRRILVDKSNICDKFKANEESKELKCTVYST